MPEGSKALVMAERQYTDEEMIRAMQSAIDQTAFETAKQALAKVNETSGKLDQHLHAYEMNEQKREIDRKHQLAMMSDLKADMKEGFTDIKKTHKEMMACIQNVGDKGNSRWMIAMKWIIGGLVTILIGLIAWEWNRLVDGVGL